MILSRTSLIFASIFFCLCCFIYIFHTQETFAQTVNNAQLSTTPQYPGPNESVTVELKNYGVNLNNLEITWSLNGAVVKKGVGETTLQFTTGNIGSISSITAATSQFSKTIQVRPTSLSLIWQAHTYTPPFYKGKALYTNQSKVDIIALPFFVSSNGAPINPETLVYTWTRNGSVVGDSSGYGKQVLSTAGGTLAKPLIVDVEVSTVDGTQKKHSSLELKGTQPHIVFYENHPLYGPLYNQAIPGAFTLTSQEISILGVPYFFEGTRKDAPQLTYTWRMNGIPIQHQEQSSPLILRRPEGVVGGVASVSLLVSNAEKILQFANRSLQIQFETLETSTNI